MKPASLKREITAIYALTFLLVLAAALVATAVGFIAQNLYIIVAAIFVLIPNYWLNRKKLSPETFGLTTSLPDFGWPRATLWAAAATAITIPLFVAGFYLWNAQFNDHRFEPALENYLQWPAELQGRPHDFAQSPGLWLYTHNNNLQVSLTKTNQQPFLITTDGDLYTLQPNARPLTLDAKTITIPPQPLPVHLGAQTTTENPDKPLTLKRSYTWILLWTLTHLIFVALPEEYFYRGYLQTRITQVLGTRKILGITQANLLTSALFALGHVLIPIGGTLLITRASVFFPSLLFGWLRERTGTILAPTLYHAACNMMVLLTAPHFF